jgi:hypothetical protein
MQARDLLAGTVGGRSKSVDKPLANSGDPHQPPYLDPQTRLVRTVRIRSNWRAGCFWGAADRLIESAVVCLSGGEATGPRAARARGERAWRNVCRSSESQPKVPWRRAMRRHSIAGPRAASRSKCVFGWDA